MSGFSERTSKAGSLDFIEILEFGSETPENRTGWNLEPVFDRRGWAADGTRDGRQGSAGKEKRRPD